MYRWVGANTTQTVAWVGLLVLLALLVTSTLKVNTESGYTATFDVLQAVESTVGEGAFDVLLYAYTVMLSNHMFGNSEVYFVTFFDCNV